MSDSPSHSSTDSDTPVPVNQNCTDVDIINNNGPSELQKLEHIDEKSNLSDVNLDSSDLPENVAHTSRTDLTLNLQSSFSENEMKCLLCAYTHPNADKIEEHINREHFDVTSPSVSNEGGNSSNFKCPFCPLTFKQARYLEAHVNVAHENIVSPQKESKRSILEKDSTSQLVCPVCGTFTSTSEVELTKHVDNHFNGPSPISPDISNDFLIANELLKAEEEQLKLDQQKEFELLQAQYGMDNEGNFKEQSIRNMQEAVISGELSVTDFYEKQEELKMAENHGVDDGSSSIYDILPRVRERSHKSLNVANTYLCSSLDFYAGSYGDRGWGCGYRNLQMMLSALYREKRYADLLVKSKLVHPKSTGRVLMPSISKLQETIEKAWNSGFDERGREQLGGRVCNTRKWIGATEIVSLLSSLRFQCQIVDVRQKSSNGLHPKMFDWIFQYFQKKEPFKAPLYLQHQGHSRTVVGMEVLKNGCQMLLILDPGVGRYQMEKSLGNWNASSSLQLLRKSICAMKSEQFQIATVVGIVSSEEEFQANKIIENYLTVL